LTAPERVGSYESYRLDYAAVAVRITGRFLDEFAAIPSA
jgi:hypothetical protein